MTVQAGVEISLELMVGEMPEVPCEVTVHDEHSASHYFQGKCNSCAYLSPLRAICADWTRRLVAGELICKVCGTQGTPQFLIPEPIKQ